MVLKDLSGRWRFVRVGANADMHPVPLLRTARLANSCCRCCHCVGVLAAALQAIQVCKEGAPIKKLWNNEESC